MHFCFLPGAGYAVLRYKGAAEELPSTPLPQPGSVTAWTLEQDAQIVISSQLRNYTNKGVAAGVYREAMSPVRRGCGHTSANSTAVHGLVAAWPGLAACPCWLAPSACSTSALQSGDALRLPSKTVAGRRRCRTPLSAC